MANKPVHALYLQTDDGFYHWQAGPGLVLMTTAHQVVVRDSKGTYPFPLGNGAVLGAAVLGTMVLGR